MNIFLKDTDDLRESVLKLMCRTKAMSSIFSNLLEACLNPLYNILNSQFDPNEKTRDFFQNVVGIEIPADMNLDTFLFTQYGDQSNHHNEQNRASLFSSHTPRLSSAESDESTSEMTLN